MSTRVYLSPPHMSGEELILIQQAFADNWIAPAGPHLSAFEQEFCEYIGAKYAVALSSGTAAIHLALLIMGIQPRDEVFVSTLTFAGSVNPIIYMGAKPVFIDSEPLSWNMDPSILETALRARAQKGSLPKAVIPVHLYGQSADMDRIMAICDEYGVPVIEDAAEAIGTLYHNRRPGTMGKLGAFSFNGNKIITTSGGGMLASDDKSLIDHARKLSSQSREPVPHYEHVEIGYNYRMSNVLAAIGLGQLIAIEKRVQRKREIYDYYRTHLSKVPGLTFVDEMPYGRHTRWLTVILVDAKQFGADREQIRLKLEEHNIESRPLWKPMHLQPVFKDYESIGGQVAESLFDRGLCLPSGTALTDEQLSQIVSIVCEMSRH
nr:aminotransferase class I/II-fold pyridoxal phosphate-dependent enzyme [Chloroflexota bacterium]NOG63794.1 aminotransferase class I/II-fold pyridoxal phosphate-dependent enzyme [Chloroflexota bacterium]GIK64972.1 MAG: pyridoxal phosphate-dependent aminotransferase [Chloroflexota bacterium]